MCRRGHWEFIWRTPYPERSISQSRSHKGIKKKAAFFFFFAWNHPDEFFSLTIYCTNFGEKTSVLYCVPPEVFGGWLFRICPGPWHVCPKLWLPQHMFMLFFESACSQAFIGMCAPFVASPCIVFAFDCPLACKLSFWSSLVAVVSATWWMDLFLQEFFVRRNSWHSAWLQALVTLCIVMSRMCLHCLEDILLCVRVECGCGVVFGSEFCARHLCLVIWKHIFSTDAVMCMDFAWTLFEFK